MPTREQADLAPVDQTELKRPLVSVVLPCLNEAGSVGLCVQEAQQTLREVGIAAEVIVVDNGSTDGSADIALAHGARLVHEPRPGYGSALRRGISHARGSVVVMADADFTYDLTKIPELVDPIFRGEADLVLGERLGDATRASMPILHRFVGTPALSLLIKRASGVSMVRDSQSGFRAFRRTSIWRLGLQSTGMEFASEMLIRAAHADLRVREVPTGYRQRIGESKLNTLSDGRRHLRLILLLAPHLLLVWPGAVLVGLGMALSAMSLLAPAGVQLGSVRWQPVFLSGILLVLGVQSLLAGVVLAYNSSVVRDSVARHYRFVGDPLFSSRCFVAGTLTFLTGLLIDLALFFAWSSADVSLTRGAALASLAQGLIIAGVTLAAFGLIYPMVTRSLVVSVPAPSLEEGEEDQPSTDESARRFTDDSLVSGED